MRALLLSINPQYVEKILAGTKRYEYRKRVAKYKSNTILVYSTSPIMKVVAKVEIVDTICAPPLELWERTKFDAGISLQKYCEYYKGCKTACAYQLGKVEIFELPKTLSEFNILLAPQSFTYVELDDDRQNCGQKIDDIRLRSCGSAVY